uniref:Uncharacterized protein n=1 Tax=Romanomermis culicivorax TaxID=13658 RepID=A0A915JZ46_ROMCU
KNSSKSAAVKQKLLPLQDANEFEKRRSDVNNQLKLLKKLNNDVKAYVATLENLLRTETRLVQNVGSTSTDLKHLSEIWNNVLTEKSKLNADYTQSYNAITSHSIKDLQIAQCLLSKNLKKWDTLSQHCLKENEKFSKLKEKERNNQQHAKLEQQEKTVETLKQDFYALHNQLSADMKRMLEGVSDIFDPTIDKLVALEIDYNTKMQKLYSTLCSKLSVDAYGGSDKVYFDQIDRKLQAIKLLSIVAE